MYIIDTYIIYIHEKSSLAVASQHRRPFVCDLGTPKCHRY